MKRRPPTSSHNYLQKIVEMQERGEIPAGSPVDVDVQHDDWCDVYRERFCNCDPTVKVRKHLH